MDLTTRLLHRYHESYSVDLELLWSVLKQLGVFPKMLAVIHPIHVGMNGREWMEFRPVRRGTGTSVGMPSGIGGV